MISFAPAAATTAAINKCTADGGMAAARWQASRGNGCGEGESQGPGEAPAPLLSSADPLQQLPELPCDIRRMIWQRAWRVRAASTLQRAWRMCMLRRAWRAMLRRLRLMRYVSMYVQKGGYAVVETQGRGHQHVHVLCWKMSLLENVVVDMDVCADCVD